MKTAELLLRRLIDDSGGPEESGYVLVMDGEGLGDLPPRMDTPRGPYGVHHVDSELGLRHLLWKAKGAPLIAVLSETVANGIQRSPDVLRRARNQRVHALSINDVLEVVLGVRVVGADAPHLQSLALQHVQQLGDAVGKRTLPTVVDRKLLTELLVDVSVGKQVRTSAPEDLLAAWAVDVPSWPDNVRELVIEALPSMHGDEGRLLSWALHEPERRLEHLLVHGAVLTVTSPQVSQNAWGDFWRARHAAPLQMDEHVLRRALVGLATRALARLQEEAAPFLKMADRLARSSLLPAQLETSRVLPLAFLNRCHALATRAAGGDAIPADDIEWLATHNARKLHEPELALLASIARLSRYLVTPAADGGDVVAQARAYQREGAFADWAIAELLRALSNTGLYHSEANKVLVRVRERRDQDNLRFAKSLAAAYSENLHRDDLVPLHRLWKRIVAPRWQERPDARLFLVVLDGCSYPVFLDLLADLASDAAFPIGLSSDREGRVVGPLGFSPLPTITSHARGAIFLGELPSDPLVAETVFRDDEEAKTDKARFAQNAALGKRTRKLFLKGDLADGGQALRDALSGAGTDGDEPIDVVAAVFNAVDDQIGSSNTGAALRIGPDAITGFKPALRAAIAAKREILLTADHGHSPYIDKQRRAGAGKTPRYTPLAKGEQAPEGFLEIDVAGLGGPPARRAFAWKTGAYLGGQQAGFHGGCGLEEMVVPMAWLSRNGLAADEPAWWLGKASPQVHEPSEHAVAAAVTPLPGTPGAPKASSQLALFGGDAAALPLSTELLAKLTSDEKGVLLLLKGNGSARASELAAKLDKNPGRLNGLIAVLKRKLHAEGHVLFSSEQLPTGETMYRYTGKEKAG